MTTDLHAPSPEPATDKPGKARAWLHPLVAFLLRWLCGTTYQVREKIHVGKKPLQIDMILLRQGHGDLSSEARRILAGLGEYLNEQTLLELKGPTDSLRSGDFRTLLAYAHLYCAQLPPPLNLDTIGLKRPPRPKGRG